jgi:foldase protein PrsA
VIRHPRLTLAVLGLTSSLALTGCGNILSQQAAAATVGDQRITTTDLQKLVDRSLANPEAKQTVGADPVAFERTALRRIISHLIVVQAAKDEGVTIDGAAVDGVYDKFAEQTGGIDALNAAATKAGIAKEDLRETLSDVALRDALADKLTASLTVPQEQLQQAYQQNIAQFDKVRSAHILVDTEAKAKQLLAALKADPSKFASFAKTYSTDTGSKDKGGDLGYQGRGALEKPFEDAIFNNPPGSLVLAKTQFGYHVISVIDRRTVTFEQATVELRRQFLSQQRTVAVEALLAKTAKRLGVDVNPRFGEWDAATQQVVAVPSCKGNAVASASPRPGDAPAADPAATDTPTPAPSCS